MSARFDRIRPPLRARQCGIFSTRREPGRVGFEIVQVRPRVAQFVVFVPARGIGVRARQIAHVLGVLHQPFEHVQSELIDVGKIIHVAREAVDAVDADHQIRRHACGDGVRVSNRAEKLRKLENFRVLSIHRS